MNFGRNKDTESSSTAKLVTSREGSRFAELVTLCCGLKLNQIHRILSMNSGEMRIRSEFSSRA